MHTKPQSIKRILANIRSSLILIHTQRPQNYQNSGNEIWSCVEFVRNLVSLRKRWTSYASLTFIAKFVTCATDTKFVKKIFYLCSIRILIYLNLFPSRKSSFFSGLFSFLYFLFINISGLKIIHCTSIGAVTEIISTQKEMLVMKLLNKNFVFRPLQVLKEGSVVRSIRLYDIKMHICYN